MAPRRPARDRDLPAILSRVLKPRGALAKAFLVHVAAGSVFLGPAFLTGGVVLPAELLHALYPWGAFFTDHTNHNREITDVILQFYPYFVFWRDQVLSGDWPLWNGSTALGLPYAANPITATYWPPTALSLLGPPTGWNLLLLLRLVLAGSSAFAFLRGTGRSFGAAAFGSVAFAYSLPFATWLPWPHANVNALLPLLFLAAERVARSPGPRPAAGFGSVLLLMHLGGHPESAFLDAGAASVVWAFAVRKAPARRIASSAGWLLGSSLVGTLAAAVQVVPFLEYLARSRVLNEPGHSAVTLPPERLLTWLVPLFFGREMDRTAWGGGLGFLDFGAFAGTSVLGLAALRLASGWPRRLAGPLAAALLSAGLAYGLPPISLLGRLPLLDRTMTHRSLPIAALAVAALGAAGWDRARARVRRSGRGPALRHAARVLLPLAAVAAGAAAFVAIRDVPDGLLWRTVAPGGARALVLLALPPLLLAAPLRARALVACSLLLVVADVWHPVFDYHGVVRRETVFFRTRATDFLASAPGAPRVLPVGFPLPPNTNLPHGIASLLSYDAIDLLDAARFLRKLGGYAGTGLFSTVEPGALSNPRVAELASVSFLLADPQAPRLDTPEFARRTGFDLTTVYDAPDGRIYRLATARPRTWFSGTAVADPGFASFDRQLAARSPSASAVPFLDDAGAAPGDGLAGVVEEESRRPGGDVVVSCEARGRGWVFFSEAFDPGWRATVNGVAAPVVRSNGPFFAVAVPAGRSLVSIRYRPRSFALGALGSLVGLAALGGLALAGFRIAGTSRRRPASDHRAALESPESGSSGPARIE